MVQTAAINTVVSTSQIIRPSTQQQQQQQKNTSSSTGSRNGTTNTNLLTRTNVFHKLIHWSFLQCDMNHTGHINQEELYTGILLVHLQLAKYAGVAACYPPSRTTIDQLFIASDHNQSGYIEEIEFTNIMMIACTQITSRIIVYYIIIICSVPYITHILIRTLLDIDQYLGFQNDIVWLESLLTYGKIVETTFSFIIFFIIVPYIFDFIDAYSRQQASSSSAAATTTDTSTIQPHGSNDAVLSNMGSGTTIPSQIVGTKKAS